jgi:maltose-binding protein MalE
MPSTSTRYVATTDRTVRRVTDIEEQEAETYRYWQSRTTAERMKAIDEIVKDGYAAKGIDVNVQRSDRSIARLQRPQR